MGLDSFYKKNLEQRAKHDTGALDYQWIKENESKDTIDTTIAKEEEYLEQLNRKIKNLNGKEPLEGDVYKKADDLLAELDAMLADIGNDSNDSKQADNKSIEINTQESFLEGLNKCNTSEELQQYVNTIIDNILGEQTTTKFIGARKGITGNLYQDNGYFDKFISPETQILNDTIGSGFHIYDRDYLYQFANGIKSLNLSANSNILQYIMPFLDNYFGLPKENVAQCVERSCLAQNILKMCGYESSINFGEAESRGKAEGHAWNVIGYDDGYLLIDFSNTAHQIENGSIIGRKPFSFSLSIQDFEEYKSGKKNLIARDFHYEKGKKVLELGNRIYAVGRSIDKTILQKQETTEISHDEFKEAAEDTRTIEARPKIFDGLTRAKSSDLEKENQNEQGE